MSADLWDTLGVGERLSSPTFAGRDAELDRLCEVLAALDAAGARTVLVGGDAGIGKTRLIEEFRDRARDAGALTAAGVCTPAEGGGLPYGPVVGVLRDLTRQLDDPTSAAILLAARRELGLDTASLPGHGSPAPNEMVKTRLFEALLQCFVSLAQHSKVVVLFEDLQWADSASVEVIDFLTRNLAASPVLLVGTYRSDEPDRDTALRRMVAELGRHRAVSHLELPGLDREATAALMAAILGQQPDWALVDAVFARSGGNPFFAEELTAARDATSLPSTLRNVVMLRVERLARDARYVVDVVAAAGGSSDHRLLAAASDLDGERLRVAVAEAVELQVLTVDDRSRLRFRHALQRDAVYDAMLPSERTRLHRQLAVALTLHPELGAAGPGHAAVELAGHWWEANELSDALHASITAADAMAALLAMPEAYAHYERAVAACERLPAAVGRQAVDYVGLLVKSADAAYLANAPQRSVELVRAALSDIDADDEPRRAASAYTMLGRNLGAVGDPDGAFDAFRRAAQLLPSDPPSVELAAVIAEEARSLMLLARYSEAERQCHEALIIARAVGGRAEEGHALCTLGCCVAELGDQDNAIALIRDALAIAETLGNPDHLNRAYNNLTHVLVAAGRLEEAAGIVFESMSEGERLVGIRLNGAGQNSAEALIRLGRWDEAEDLLGRMDDHGIGSCVFGPRAVRALLSIRRGRFEDAAERLAAGDELSAGIGTVQVRGWFHMLRAELALEQRDPGHAHNDIEHALSIAAGTDDNAYRPEMCALGIRAIADEYAAARAGGRRVDTDKCRRLAAALVDQAEHHVAFQDDDNRGRCSPRSIALLALCQAEASRLDASDADAWQTAAQRWDEASEPYFASYCRFREGEAVLAGPSGRRRATDAVLTAWQACVRMGAAPLQERIERLAQRARIPLINSDTTAADPSAQRIAEDLGLTSREVEVLAQLARGRTDRQIADELFISKKTASVHVSNILRKLDAANRIEAAEIGQRVGLE